MPPDHPYGVRLLDSYDDSHTLMELGACTEEDRAAFLTELGEVAWVYRALENDRIGSLGVSDKMGQSTLSLHVSLFHLYVVRLGHLKCSYLSFVSM